VAPLTALVGPVVLVSVVLSVMLPVTPVLAVMTLAVFAVVTLVAKTEDFANPHRRPPSSLSQVSISHEDVATNPPSSDEQRGPGSIRTSGRRGEGFPDV
jgi:hypothetical protein